MDDGRYGDMIPGDMDRKMMEDGDREMELS